MSLALYTGSRRLMRALYTLLCLVLLAFKATAAATNYAANLASLLHPAKLATLGPRGANPRVQKAVYWLAVAWQHGQKPEAVLDRALAGKMSGDAMKLTKAALLRNLDIAEKLGCLDAGGLRVEFRITRSPISTRLGGSSPCRPGWSTRFVSRGQSGRRDSQRHSCCTWAGTYPTATGLGG